MEGDSANSLIARSKWKKLMKQPNPAIEQSVLIEANGINLHVRMFFVLPVRFFPQGDGKLTAKKDQRKRFVASGRSCG
jgi:hypothetical protein